LFYHASVLMQQVLRAAASAFKRPFPEIRSGYTVRVHQKVQEGSKERVQIFEGLVISVHKGRFPTDTTFTVRRIVQSVGVEKVFPLCSPNIVKIEVVKVARVRRAKLFFLRGRRGKAARLAERFTTADEFQVAVAKKEDSEESEEGAVEAAGKGETVEEEKDEEKSEKKK
jgi:large subunit ribosomal protein L19